MEGRLKADGNEAGHIEGEFKVDGNEVQYKEGMLRAGGKDVSSHMEGKLKVDGVQEALAASLDITELVEWGEDWFPANLAGGVANKQDFPYEKLDGEQACSIVTMWRIIDRANKGTGMVIGTIINSASKPAKDGS